MRLLRLEEAVIFTQSFKGIISTKWSCFRAPLYLSPDCGSGKMDRGGKFSARGENNSYKLRHATPKKNNNIFSTQDREETIVVGFSLTTQRG